MNVNLVTAFGATVKSSILSVMNEYNDIRTNVPVSNVEFFHSSDKHTLLKELTTTAGVLVNKISISSLLPSKLDITSFKNIDKARFRLQSDFEIEVLQKKILDFNEKREIPLIGLKESECVNKLDVPEDTWNDFILFCRVYGFWILNAEELVLNKIDDTLFIGVVPTHPIYKGSVEVKV